MSSFFQSFLLPFFVKRIPFLLGLFLLLMSLIPIKIAFFSYFHISFVYIVLFFWGVFAPYLLSSTYVFLLGVIADFLTSGFFGLNTFLFLLFYALVVLNRRFLERYSFLFVWATFATALVVFLPLQWGVESLLRVCLLPIFPFLIQDILLIICAPFLIGINFWFYLKLIR